MPPVLRCHLLQGTGKLWVYYWMGLSYNTTFNSWLWTDGGNAGNGAVKNSNPYAHWAYDAQDALTTYPAYKCIIGNYYRRYDMVGKPHGAVERAARVAQIFSCRRRLTPSLSTVLPRSTLATAPTPSSRIAASTTEPAPPLPSLAGTPK
jgi:hypothetical protein